MIPPESEKNVGRANEFRDKAVAGLFIGSMVPLVFQIGSLENTIGGLKLFWWSLVAGIAIGFAIVHYVIARHFSVPSKEVSLKEFYLLSVWVCALLAPACGSMLNRYAPSSAPYQGTFAITGKCVARSRGSESYFLLFRNGQSVERVQVSESFFRSRSSGENMTFRMRSGFLGFPVIEGIK